MSDTRIGTYEIRRIPPSLLTNGSSTLAPTEPVIRRDAEQRPHDTDAATDQHPE